MRTREGEEDTEALHPGGKEERRSFFTTTVKAEASKDWTLQEGEEETESSFNVLR